MLKVKSFFLDSVEEIRHKVTWPSYSDLKSSSTLVLVASFVFAVTIGLIDLIFKNAISWIYSNF